ncbi:hypothetical protein BDV34DRAFT_145504 [Aspergillus parasiticus]|uniref:Secreted protein n=1 Tax=Aspergillus parasiticus TaxID=5067 RepID=A0A5N6DCL8_ASPPA|nr:hypothetical protein BDV34DRAFT_145504 [Aspergillus parasiticus]
MAPTMSLITLAVASWSLVYGVTAGVIFSGSMPTVSGITTSPRPSSSHPGIAAPDPLLLLTQAANHSNCRAMLSMPFAPLMPCRYNSDRHCDCNGMCPDTHSKWRWRCNSTSSFPVFPSAAWHTRSWN